jgi:3-deoxy-D-manno-octulosonate 8-phosphate phosphatase (KDO 8-P phosphatase)
MSNNDFKNIKLLLMDLDGVLTDGGVYISNKGETFRKFNVLDGFGIRKAIRESLEIIIISGGTSEAINHRADILGIKYVFLGREDKKQVYLEKIKPKFDIKDEQVAYIADDIYDIPLMKIVGFPITVPNAHDEVKKIAKHITKRGGGQGAVREVIDLILK